MANRRAQCGSSYHHGDLKAVLLNETARILREEGEEALSLRRLATTVGVSRTAPYHHFKNKQSLLCAVAEEGFVRFDQAMKLAMRKSLAQEGREMMRDYARAYVSFAVKNREYYDLMYGAKTWRSDVLAKSLAKSARGTLRANIERLQTWQARGGIEPSIDVPGFAQVAWGTLHGISRLLIDGIYTDSASVRRICDNAADMLWYRLAHER